MYFLKSGENLELLAPAKLNIFLELLARRDDGFHEIETLMVAVNIYDTLRISARSDGQISLSCRWAGGVGVASDAAASRASQSGCEPPHARPGLPAKIQDNLVWQAVEKLRERAGNQLGATIELIKRIPAAAGLGGASSDAAAALVAANELWKLGLSQQQLVEMAAELGSDVPFFLSGGAAICRGRGERMEPVNGLPRMNFVVVQPPAGLSTQQVYGHCRVPDSPRHLAPLLEAAIKGRLPQAGQAMCNRLEEPAAQLSPWIECMRREFERLDVCGHQMSGSGTSYFGLCRSARHACRVGNQLRGRIAGNIFCVHSLPPQGRP